MAVIALGGTKGGTGKSTQCCNLAAMRAKAGRRVLIVDTDKQRTAADWGSFRQDAEITPRIKVESKYIKARDANELGQKGRALIQDVNEAAQLYDDVLIDSGGEDSPALRFIMLCADLMLVPFAPSGPDIWALTNLEEVYSTVSGMGREGFVPVLYASNVSPITSERERIQGLAEDYPGLHFLTDVAIYHRAAYRHSLAEGRSIVEMSRPDPKAKHELLDLYRAAFGETFQPVRETA